MLIKVSIVALELCDIADVSPWPVSLLSIQLSIQKQAIGPYWTPQTAISVNSVKLPWDAAKDKEGI